MINIENINQTQYLEKQLDVLKQNLKSVKTYKNLAKVAKNYKNIEFILDTKFDIF